MKQNNTTQFTLDPYSKDVIDVVIGFDFGTSSTKVIIQTPAFAGGKSFLVPFGDMGYKENKYLMPTQMFYDEDGNFSISKFGSSKTYNNIKLKLLSEPNSIVIHTSKIRASEFASIYIAFVLFKVRTWFLKTQEKIYKQYKLRWQLNVGIPSKEFDEEPQKSIYKNVAINAWKFSMNNEMKHISDFRNSIESPLKEIEETDINIIPEIIAGVVGYARSYYREDGLHLMIDIGARTLDIASFNLHSDEGEDRYPLLIADVQPLGAYVCHIESTKTIMNYLFQDAVNKYRDMIVPLPIHFDEYFGDIESRLIEIQKKQNMETSFDFFIKCKKMILMNITKLKTRRDPNSNNWKEGLPVFISGGGKHLKIYRKVLELAQNILINQYNMSHFNFKEIRIPHNLHIPENFKKQYYRFTVAYGLSFEKENIGEMKGPRKIKDINPNKSNGHPYKTHYEDTKDLM